MGNVTAKEFAATWLDPSFVGFRKELGNTLSLIGGKTSQVYADVTVFFSDSISNFLAENPRETVNAGKNFAKSQTAKDFTSIAEVPKNFADEMKRQFGQMMVDIDYTINESANGVDKIKAAIGANTALISVSEIASNFSALALEETGETTIAIADSLQKSLLKVADSCQ